MEVILSNLDVYLRGMWATAVLTGLSFALALLVGTLTASARASPVPPLRMAGTVYVEAFRNTPLVVLMFLWYFGLPKLGYRFEAFPTAIAVLGLYTGAFVAETIRSGINSVGPGQAEAARSIGLGFVQVLGLVVLPQALRTVVVPLGSVLIALIKNSAVAYTISAAELARAVDDLGSREGYTVALAGGALAYLALTIPTGRAVAFVERKVAIRR